MALFYRYYFMLGDHEQCIYGESEVVARAKFKHAFNMDAGDLLRRENW